MTDTEFLERVNTTLAQVEQYIENLVDSLDLDADWGRAGNVLTLDFEDKGKLILNSQVAVHELWLAAKSGGYHYACKPDGWVHTRGGEPFAAHFVAVLAQQLGQPCPPLN